MTEEKKTLWQKINTPKTRSYLPWVLLAIMLLLYIFLVEPVRKKNQEKVLFLESENELLKKKNIDDSVFREIMVSKIDVLQNSFNKKQTDKQIIYERIRTNIHHYDTASIEEYQRFFDQRYNTPAK